MTERFNGSKMTRIVKELGSLPRLVGSPGEKKGINYCKKKFSELDIDLEEEPVVCVRGWLGWIQQLLFTFGSILVAVIIAMLIYQPWVNLIILGIIIILLAVVFPGLMGTGGLKKIGQELTTQNLIQTVKPKDNGETKQYIILSAHHDSKSQTLPTVLRGLSYLLMAIGLVLLILVIVAAIIIDLMPATSVPEWLVTIGIIFAVLTWCGTIPLALNFLGNKSPGAIDNASAIAVIYEVCRYLKEIGGLENTELVVAIFGAEEVGMWGAREFCRNHLDDFPPEKTKNINLDMVGFKGAPVQVMESAGIPVKKKISGFMTSLAKKVAKEKHIDLQGFWMPIGASTDGFVLRDYGYDGAEFNVFKASTHTHLKSDDFDMWDEKIAVKNCEIIAGMIEKLDIHGFTQDFA